MPEIEYSYNWNNKLSCKAHTSIRLRNDNKYVVGQVYQETLKGKHLQDATLVAIKHLKLSQVNEFIARLDTGYSVDECKKLITTMYKNKCVDWETQELSLLLLVTDQKTQAAPAATNDKIALFCRKYEEHTGVQYKVSRADAGKVKELPLEAKLLDLYFTTDHWMLNGRHSIAHLARYWNEIQQLVSGSGVHPNKWDEKYAASLDQDKLQSYYAHLRKLGYVHKYSPTGGSKWVKERTH